MTFKNIDKGILYMLLASFLFAFMGAFAKELSSHMSSLEVVFFRNIFGVLLLGATLFGRPMNHKGGKPFLLLFRGLIGFVAVLAFFYNIANIALADAITFSKTSPIFTAFFAWLFLKEKISSFGWLALFIGFIGIVLITQPSGLTLTKTDLLGIFSGVGAALAYTSVKELKKYYDTRAIVLSFTGVGTIGPIILMLIAPYIESSKLDFLFAEFVMPSGEQWFSVVAMGTLATLAQIFMTKAYGISQAGLVATISYSTIAFSIILGILLGDAFPTLVTILGILLITVAGILVAKKPKKVEK